MISVDYKVRVFEGERKNLFGLAYRMLSEVGEAEEIVQEAWLRWNACEEVDNPAAWLTKVTSRLSIDHLRSAHSRRVSYVGPWLPEPLTTGNDDPADRIVADETISLGFLVAMETLGPIERAVFLLHDVFDLSYTEVAEIVEKTEPNCRQIASRARKKLGRANQVPGQVANVESDLLVAFLIAVDAGEYEALVELLTDDIVLTSDGGANRRAARYPVVGPHRVSRFMVGIAKKASEHEHKFIEVNGRMSLVAMANGQVDFVLAVEGRGGKVRRITTILAPEKTSRLLA